MITAFTVDKKLDNRRVEISCSLIKLSFAYGQSKINREEIFYKSRSGYCLDAVQKAGHSGFDTVSIEDIGKVRTWHSRNSGRGIYYIVYCYPELEKDAEEEIKSKVRLYKAHLLLKALTIPTL